MLKSITSHTSWPQDDQGGGSGGLGPKTRSGRKRRRGDRGGNLNETPKKKRRRVAVVSSPSAEDQSSTRSKAKADGEDVLSSDPLAISTLLERPDWKKVTLRQMELELLLPRQRTVGV